MNEPTSLIPPEIIQWWCDLASKCPDGAFAEVGVYKGGSAWHLAKVAREQGRKLYLYDTFEGTPVAAKGDEHDMGDFYDCPVDAVQEAIPDAVIVKGIFPDTFIDDQIAFAHIDCDQYWSVYQSCKTIWPRVVHGGIMVFDDPPFVTAAAKAVTNFFGDRILKSGPKWCVRKENGLA